MEKNKKKRIEFEGRLKKVDLFNDTLHLIIYPKGSITKVGKLYDIEKDKNLKITISILND